ncbi:hypothetical protein JCM9279_004862 [Rhodotorula babjevae]
MERPPLSQQRQRATLARLVLPADLHQLTITDHLTQLPAELFITICELVVEAKQGPYLAFVSRAFVPVARKLAFRKVEVKQYDHLQALCEVIAESQPLAECIEELELDMRESRPDAGVPRTTTLSSTFRRLINLDKLDVKSSSRLAKLVVSPEARWLPRLSYLDVTDPFTGWSNPFEPRNLRHLNNYPILDSFSLDVNRPLDSLGRYHPARESQPFFGDYEWLSLKGPLGGNPAVSDLLSCFSPIQVCLHDFSPSDVATLPALLDKVVDSEYVFVLSIRQVAPDPQPLVEALGRFPRLGVLELLRGTWTSAMLPMLRTLEHLEQLIFLNRTNVTIDDLRRMMSGPTKLEHLKTIVLQVLWWDDDVDDLEGWTPTFSLDGLIGLLPLADEAGVKLEGNAVSMAREVRDHAAGCATCRAAAVRRAA